MKRIFFIVVPSLVPTGPVKGAIALANQLVRSRRVLLVVLKPGAGAAADIDDRIEAIYLWKKKSRFLGQTRAYRRLLRQVGATKEIVSISMCFSADLVNLFVKNNARICSSVRGNLPVNYQMDYGLKGRLLAYVHLILLRCFDVVTAMTAEMSVQIAPYLGRSPLLVGNFVDEMALEKYRERPVVSESVKFVFVGSLTTRKRPELLIQAIKQLHLQGHLVELDMLGCGPLESALQNLVAQLDMKKYVRLHGQVDEPYPVIRAANVFVLPSMSEGLSRAALEALFLGTPCVLRRVDGNQGLISNGINGILFDSDEDLPRAMLDALQITVSGGENLLPSSCSQAVQTMKLLNVLETLNDG